MPLRRKNAQPNPRADVVGPARTFSDILDSVESAQRLEKRPSLLQRAATATLQIVRFGSAAEKASRAAKAEARRAAARVEARREAERAKQAWHEALRARPLWRDTAAGESTLPDDSGLAATVEHNVLPNPRPSRFIEDADAVLILGLVARLSGCLENGGYVFLGGDGSLYAGGDPLGHGARRIPAGAEGNYSEYRDMARACFQFGA
ncbi:hypothetical protein F4802DRAFT_544437 [Xylaria palmicola]|nr:hypothetical protein F4802DRAFT_544437 [Xylaria palmicola]